MGNHLRLTHHFFLVAVLFTYLTLLFPLKGFADEFLLKPKTNPEITSGKIAMVEGLAGPEGQKFLIEGLSILQPVEINVFTRNPEKKLNIQLAKFDLTNPDKEGSTDKEGEKTFKIRTEGDMKILVRSLEEQIPYQLVVWVGDKVEPAMSSPFIPMSNGKKSSGTTTGSETNFIVWMIALLLLGILIMLVLIFLKGKTPKTLQIFTILTTLLLPFNTGIAGLKNVDEILAVGDLWKAGEVMIKSGKSLDNLNKEYENLSREDESMVPDYDPPGTPEVPSNCVDNDDLGCTECYGKAYAELNELRRNFEELRAVKQSTTNYVKAALALGDNTSGIHGVAGMAWQAERLKIEKSFKNFETVYRKKYAELVGRLESVLKEIDQCEAKHFGVNDWYNRYGYMYYTFMADRYQW